MDPQLQFKLNLYQNSPDVFNDDELDLFKSQLESAGADKSIIDGIQHAGPKRDGNFSLLRAVGNFIEGTVEGATTLPVDVTGSQHVFEDIARSVGSLGGFVGGIFIPANNDHGEVNMLEYVQYPLGANSPGLSGCRF